MAYATPADYLLVDRVYGQTHGFRLKFLAQHGSRFGAASVSTLLASLPEPSTLAAFCFALLPLTRRRR